MSKQFFISRTIYIFGFIFLLVLASCTSSSSVEERDDNNVSMVGSITQTSSTIATGGISETPAISMSGSVDRVWPIDDGKDRVTKKKFGLQVSPKNSPISLEKFSGWHTGTDFETTEAEQGKEIEIRAVCTGPLIYKNWVSGYGGVAIQKCTLNDESVTVLYGHLKLESIIPTLNTEIKTGEKIEILGAGYSTETDDERKHLHLSIHKGTIIDLKGYVPTQSALDAWINPMEYLDERYI